MLGGADRFNQDISRRNVSNVRDMHEMFIATLSFNQNLSLWNVSNVITMRDMFVRATAFDQDVASWELWHPYKFDSNWKFDRG